MTIQTKPCPYCKTDKDVHVEWTWTEYVCSCSGCYDADYDGEKFVALMPHGWGKTPQEAFDDWYEEITLKYEEDRM